jgi:GNAT superfamily N-acetyltransferase
LKTCTISKERPDTHQAQALVAELEAYLAALYPIKARHGLSVARLLEENVAFFLLRYDGLPAGCGGVKCFGKSYAELKRMYVRPGFRKIGLGKRILEYLEAYARNQNVPIIRLETGIYQKAAIRLYERMGYQKREPFGDYEDGPFNLFYEKLVEHTHQ